MKEFSNLKINYLRVIVWASLFIPSPRADSSYIFKATDKGIAIGQYTENLNHSEINQILCQTKKINQIWAFPAKCLKHIHSVTSHGKRAHGIRLKYWREKNDYDAEYNLAYTSQMAKNTSLKIFHSYNQPKEKWISQDIYLPDLAFINNKATLNFHPNDLAIFRYVKKLRNPNSPYITNFSDSSRYKIKPFQPLSDFDEHRLFNNNAIWIHEIEWFLDSFTEQKAVNAEYLSNLKSNHRTFFENTEYQMVLIILFIFGMGIALWAVTRYLQVQLMSSLIMPTTLLIIFMAKPMIDYFDSLEEIKLQKIRHEIEIVYEKIKQTQLQGLQQIHQKIVKQKHLLQKNLELTKFSRMFPDIKPNFNYQKSSHSELINEIRRLRQNQQHELLNRVNTHLGKKVYDYYLPRVNLKYSLMNKKEYSLNERNHLEQEYLELVYQNSPISKTLRYLKLITGLDLKLSNGKCVLEVNTYSKGFKNLSGIEHPLMSQILYNIGRTPLEVSQLTAGHRQAIIDLRKAISNLGISPKFISNYMNEPKNWHTIGSGRKDDSMKLYSWQLIDAKNGPWVLLMSMNQETLIREINSIIEAQNLNKLVLVSASKSKDFNSLKKYKKQNISMDYYFLGEKNRESFPLDKSNSYLSRAANLAKIKGTTIMLPTMDENDSYVGVGFPLNFSPAYSLAIGRKISSEWKALLQLKSRIQWFIFLLILSPLILATTIAGRITKPLKQMGKAVSKIAQGHYKTKLNLKNIDEFSKLSTHFNRMSVALQKYSELTYFISYKSLHSLLKTEQSSRREEVTILFCGIHNFQDYHDINPKLAKEYLQQFILVNHTAISGNKGMIDKFTGVAILAIFRGVDKEKFALKSADYIRHSIVKSNEKSEIPFKVGIGIATGTVILGQVGAHDRKDFTCIGNTVNMAARLETLSNKTDTQFTFYLDQSTLNSASELDIEIKELSPTQIKGKKDLQKVYELVSIS